MLGLPRFFFFLRRRPYAVQRASALVLLVFNSNTWYFFVSLWWAWLGAMLLRHLPRFVASFTPPFNIFLRHLPRFFSSITLLFFALAVTQINPFRGPIRLLLLRIQVFRQAL